MKYFLLGIYGVDDYSLIGDGHTSYSSAKSAQSWQNKAGFGGGYAIVRPTEERGVFVEHDAPECRYKVSRGGWTPEAFERTLNAIWGEPK